MLIRGIDRYWKAREFKQNISMLGKVDCSRLIPMLSTRESLVPENYERDELFGRLSVLTLLKNLSA
jgi:hypothetical protein